MAPPFTAASPQVSEDQKDQKNQRDPEEADYVEQAVEDSGKPLQVFICSRKRATQQT